MFFKKVFVMGEKFIDDENDKNQGPKFRLILDNQRLVAELQRQLLARERERQRQGRRIRHCRLHWWRSNWRW